MRPHVSPWGDRTIVDGLPFVATRNTPRTARATETSSRADGLRRKRTARKKDMRTTLRVCSTVAVAELEYLMAVK